jgi:hypothetical protein
VTIIPTKDVKKSGTGPGAELLAKLRKIAAQESSGEHIVQVRVTPKKLSADHNCQCCCG